MKNKNINKGINKCNDVKTKQGTRSNAFWLLLNFSEYETELFGEIQASFEMTKNYLSPGIKNSLEHKISELENSF